MTKDFITGKLEDFHLVTDVKESPFGEITEHKSAEFAEKYHMKPEGFYDFASMNRYLYPASISQDRLLTITLFNNFWFAFDDAIIDAPDQRTYGEELDTVSNAAELVESLLKVLKLRQLPPKPLRLHLAMQAISEKLLKYTNQAWVEMMTLAVSGYLMAGLNRYKVLSEAGGDNTTFSNLRDMDTGGLQAAVLLEIGYDVVLPHHIRTHPTISKMTGLCYRSAAFVNDIISYPKDVYDEQSEFNLVLQFEREGCSLDAAIDRSIALVNNLQQEFLDLEAHIPADKRARDYVQACKDFMAGNIYWHCLSPRYRHPRSPFKALRQPN